MTMHKLTVQLKASLFALALAIALATP
jgi:hypothetical protein